MALIRLAHVSRPSLPGNFQAREAVADLLSSARRSNEAAGVTGALLVADAAFAQVLEGEQGAVEATDKRITCHRRRHDIVLLLREPVPGRQFPQWAMAHIGPSQSAEEAVVRVSQTLPGTDAGAMALGLVTSTSRVLGAALDARPRRKDARSIGPRHRRR